MMKTQDRKMHISQQQLASCQCQISSMSSFVSASTVTIISVSVTFLRCFALSG